ncbi:hypothetical protein HYS03_01705, partial [Candidatus Woesebacteria bacterium]|nr:hypothetical protein [Candidatus Woesebacteria bacterium]
KTVEACVKGELSQNKAEIELARQFSADRDNFWQSMQTLEDKLDTGKTIVGTDTRMIPEGRVNLLIYNDNTVKAFQCRPNGEVVPVMPNHNFTPMIFGTKLQFVDNEGIPHRSVEEVIIANQRGEEVSNPITRGNCPQDPKFAPDFEIDRSRV